jgi:hypothetical protein
MDRDPVWAPATLAKVRQVNAINAGRVPRFACSLGCLLPLRMKNPLDGQDAGKPASFRPALFAKIANIPRCWRLASPFHTCLRRPESLKNLQIVFKLRVESHMAQQERRIYEFGPFQLGPRRRAHSVYPTETKLRPSK